MEDLKVIFMGTPDFSLPILSYLIENTNVVLVVTQPDKKKGKNNELSFSPTKKLAIQKNIAVFQPNKIKEDYEIISEINPDIIITCAYGQILPEEILNIPRLGCINVHASLLPKYRGASPIQWALLNGDKTTGVTIMYMDKSMDTGDIIAMEAIDIKDSDNVKMLHDKLSILGQKLLAETLPLIIKNQNSRIKQDERKASYTRLIKREDEKIAFNNNGKDIINKIRAFTPWPGAYIILNGLETKITKASFIKNISLKIKEVLIDKNNMYIGCNDGSIRIERLKVLGKKEMDIKSFLNGFRNKGDINVE